MSIRSEKSIASQVVCIIPVLNEEQSIGKVLDAIPRDWVGTVLVVDNGSVDRTAEIAKERGAIVLAEPERGYGAACLKGLSHCPAETEIVLFLDGDYSDFPEEAGRLIRPIWEDEADMVIGSRAQGNPEKGSLTVPQRFGNLLATSLIHALWGFPYTDLGPFRAIRKDLLDQIQMNDRNYGWTVEMQIKAIVAKARIMEVPVRYRNRIGESKVSGTLRGVWGAGTKILWTIGKYAWETK